MKTLLMSVIVMLAVSGVNSVAAQSKSTTTAQDLVQNLSATTVQDGLINLGGIQVNVSNVTVQDLVNVQNVLNNANINILNNVLNNNDIAKNISVTLTNLLRDARILNKNQIIVGVLSGQDGTLKFVRQNARSVK